MHPGPNSRRKSRVVCYGRDEYLLTSRSLVLETRFHTTVAADLDSLKSQLTAGCDLVVLCHSLGMTELNRACELVRSASPATLLLRLVLNTSSLSPSPCRETFLMYDGPAALVTRVSELLAAGRKRTALGPAAVTSLALCADQRKARLPAAP